MFKLQKLNVIKFVDSEQKKKELLAKGFVEIQTSFVSKTINAFVSKTKRTKKDKN